MSLYNLTVGIQQICDFDKVSIKMLGEKEIIIKRPPSVSVQEWFDFWGGDVAPQGTNWGPKFTHDEAMKKHKAFIENAK
jgi:hypothetical protein